MHLLKHFQDCAFSIASTFSKAHVWGMGNGELKNGELRIELQKTFSKGHAWK